MFARYNCKLNKFLKAVAELVIENSSIINKIFINKEKGLQKDCGNNICVIYQGKFSVTN